jgi:hypothetical protein
MPSHLARLTEVSSLSLPREQPGLPVLAIEKGSRRERSDGSAHLGQHALANVPKFASSLHRIPLYSGGSSAGSGSSVRFLKENGLRTSP